MARDLYLEAGGSEVLWPYHGWLSVLRSDERIELRQPIEDVGDSLTGMSRHVRPPRCSAGTTPR